jgi:hypothetical protein
VKTAFQQRQKAYHPWHNAEAELQKRKAAQDKLLRQGRSQQDKLNQVSAEVNDAERRVHQARLLFEDMGRLMRSELERFEKEKVEDFKSGVETYLESAVEAQKEVSIFSSLTFPPFFVRSLFFILQTNTTPSSSKSGKPSSCSSTPKTAKLSSRPQVSSPLPTPNPIITRPKGQKRAAQWMIIRI